jgi:hypothetical protein
VPSNRLTKMPWVSMRSILFLAALSCGTVS